MSLNPEIIVLSQENEEFRKVLNEASVTIIDGIGIVLAAKILGVPVGTRLTGTDCMQTLLGVSSKMRLRSLFIGGRENLAVSLSRCYSQKYPEASFRGIEGIKNIKKPEVYEEDAIFSIVADYKPHIIFVSFGSPYQELWLSKHQKKLEGIICMGVGGAFDFEAKTVQRAPQWVQKIGTEWLFRLFVQPWRWRRQLRLLKFLFLVIKERLHK